MVDGNWLNAEDKFLMSYTFGVLGLSMLPVVLKSSRMAKKKNSAAITPKMKLFVARVRKRIPTTMKTVLILFNF